MILEKATIVALDKDKAVIVKEVSQACEGCHLSGSCLSSGDVRCDQTYVVPNSAGAGVGDHVEIGLSSPEFFISVLLVYLMPLVLLFIGFALGTRYAPVLSKALGRSIDPTVLAVVVGLFFFVGSFILLYVFNRWCKKKGLFVPEIVRILP